MPANGVPLDLEVAAVSDVAVVVANNTQQVVIGLDGSVFEAQVNLARVAAALMELVGNEVWASATDVVVDKWGRVVRVVVDVVGSAAAANAVDAVNALDKGAECR